MKILFPYTGRFRTILGSFKFKKSLGIGNFFALCLNLVIDESEQWEEAVWVPVPPRPGKIRKQGWDQIEFLAALLEKVRYRGLAVNRCLKRLPSKTQKKLNREERSMNLKGRIICVKKPPKIAVLFDDVITTGATLDVCAAALLEGGAEKVYGVCLFYD
jgi:ComF family protein